MNVKDLFRSLCVLEKQMVLPKSMFSNLWRLTSRETDSVMRKFVDLGLITKTVAKMASETSPNGIRENYGVRLHDLILVLCQEMSEGEQEKRHESVLDALKSSKSVWIHEELPTAGESWRLKDDGYIYGNISRHMVKCARTQALANLLSDVRWTIRRIEVGRWLPLKMDYELLFARSDDAEVQDIRQVCEVLERHWSAALKDENLLMYYIGGSLSAKERKKRNTALYMNSMTRFLSRPFLAPRSKFLGLVDSRELSVLIYERYPNSLCMDFSRSTDKAVVCEGMQISVCSISTQKEVSSFRSRPALSCIAIKANGSLVVAGHCDGTLMRWDAQSGEAIGIEIEAHNGWVKCIAIGEEGSIIATGSTDKTVCLWGAMEGKPKSIPMNHEDEVTCVAICENGSMIVFGSMNGTVSRWNIKSSTMIGGPMRGNKNSVACVSVSENGKMIVSGSRDKTLVRWDAKTGKQIGEPMCGHSVYVESIAISRCGTMIVSGS